MPKGPTLHPVYRSLNKPLTIAGAERRLFFLALVIGGATFNLFGSLLGGILMFLVLLHLGALGHRHGPANLAHSAEFFEVQAPVRSGQACGLRRRTEIPP